MSMSEVVGILMLDVEAVADRFHESALSNAVIYPDQYMVDALWYLANGMYQLHYVMVEDPANDRVIRLGQAYVLQQWHSGSTPNWPFSRSMAPGDAAVLKDKSVWVLTGPGWRQINVA